MHLRPIQLEVRRSVVTDFKRLAKEVFPKEAFAYILGREAGNLVEIEDIWVPLDLDKWNDLVSVTVSDDWLPAAKKEAKDLGLTVVGSIHSHPHYSSEDIVLQRACVPSAPDLETGYDQIYGICGVMANIQTGKLRASLKFWGPTFQVRTEIK